MNDQIYNFELSSADEEIVRTYECTRLRKMFSPPTIGYLTVTNKRVLFHSSGKSITGKSELINDMPLEDTASVSAYVGLSINWLMFIIFALLLFGVTYVLNAVAPFFTSWGFAIVLMLPMGAAWLLTSNILNEELRDQIFKSVAEITGGRLKLDREGLIYEPYIRIPFWIGLSILAYYIAFRSEIISQIPFLNYIVLIAAYFAIFILSWGRQRTFSLLIGSKTMKDSGIYIPGDSFRLFGSRESTAIESQSAGPAVDAEKVVRELGAMLMDIRQMGDLGIEKWKS